MPEPPSSPPASLSEPGPEPLSSSSSLLLLLLLSSSLLL
jgi:hypothetical protein